jgi:tryptophan-rich sensory protein
MSVRMLLRQPSAFLPVIMSAIALATVLTHVAVYGAARVADEGTAAHVFQLLIVAQLPIVAYFAIKFLSRTPRPALIVLIIQACAGLAALAPVFFLHL